VGRADGWVRGRRMVEWLWPGWLVAFRVVVRRRSHFWEVTGLALEGCPIILAEMDDA
jgi:hypothetical protein